MFAAIIYTDVKHSNIEQVLAPFDSETDAIDEALEYTDNIDKIETGPLVLFDDNSEEE